MALELLQELLKKHETVDFNVGNNIPETKLVNAVTHFPVNSDLSVLGLIDCTIMGSNKKGLAITENGLIWNNGWTSDTRKKDLTWSELSEFKKSISVDKYDVHFGDGIQFSLAGSSMSAEDAFPLFIDLIELYDGLIADKSTSNNQQLINIDDIQLDVKTHSTKEQTNYEETLIISLALMTVADGEVDKAEVDLVTAFIEEEDSIHDKNTALSSFQDYIYSLELSQKKSDSLFKLQSKKLLKKVVNLNNQSLINDLEIMLEGMVDVAGGKDNHQTVDMMKNIMEKQLHITTLENEITTEKKSNKKGTVASISVGNTPSLKFEELHQQTMIDLQAEYDLKDIHIDTLVNEQIDIIIDIMDDILIAVRKEAKKSSDEENEATSITIGLMIFVLVSTYSVVKLSKVSQDISEDSLNLFRGISLMYINFFFKSFDKIYNNFQVEPDEDDINSLGSIVFHKGEKNGAKLKISRLDFIKKIIVDETGLPITLFGGVIADYDKSFGRWLGNSINDMADDATYYDLIEEMFYEMGFIAVNKDNKGYTLMKKSGEKNQFLMSWDELFDLLTKGVMSNGTQISHDTIKPILLFIEKKMKYNSKTKANNSDTTYKFEPREGEGFLDSMKRAAKEGWENG